MVSVFCAVFSHEKRDARTIPLDINDLFRPSSFITLLSVAAISKGFFGFASCAALPHISGIQVVFDATTGIPDAIASISGRPKPSKKVQKNKISAFFKYLTYSS